MKFNKVHYLDHDQKSQILTIWNQEYPASLKYANLSEFEAYLAKLEEANHYLLKSDQQEVLAWLATFNRDSKRWLVIIVSSSQQGQGVGRQLLEMAKADEPVLYAWVTDHNTAIKANGEYYLSPLAFYLKYGFETVEGERLDNEKVSAVKMRWISKHSAT